MPSLRVMLPLLVAAFIGQPTPERFNLSIRGVRIVHGDGRVTPRATVLVAGGRVRQIANGVDLAPAGHVIDGRGRTLIPGLVDANVQLEPWMHRLLLEHGVTTVRDTGGAPASGRPAAGDAIDRPRVVAGAVLGGPETIWPNAVAVDDVGDARDAVRLQVARGAEVVVVLPDLRPSVVAVVVREARARGASVAAHLGRTNALQAASAGVASIEHLTGIAEAASPGPEPFWRAHDDFFEGWAASILAWPRLKPATLQHVASTLHERGVVLVPTLALYEAFAQLADASDARPASEAIKGVPDRVRVTWTEEQLLQRTGWSRSTLAGFARALPRLQQFVAAYQRLGGAIAAGSGAPQGMMVPGAALHRELELYVEAGLSPAEALHTATAGAAALLGLGDHTGRIEEGLAADLVLIDGDPLADITATRRIVTVIRGGVEVR